MNLRRAPLLIGVTEERKSLPYKQKKKLGWRVEEEELRLRCRATDELCHLLSDDRGHVTGASGFAEICKRSKGARRLAQTGGNESVDCNRTDCFDASIVTIRQ